MWKLLFCFMIIPCNIAAMAVVADYSNKSIVDDYIAQAIRGIKPASITDLINSLERRRDEFDEITSFDVRDNNIGLSGAIKLFKFIAQNLKNLEDLNLSGNRIQYDKGMHGYEEFEKLLMQFIQKQDTHRSVALGGNYLGIEWYRYMESKLSAEDYEKIL